MNTDKNMLVQFTNMIFEIKRDLNVSIMMGFKTRHGSNIIEFYVSCDFDSLYVEFSLKEFEAAPDLLSMIRTRLTGEIREAFKL